MTFAATIDLSDLDGTNGFRLDGVGNSDLSGAKVASAGDVNGDGHDDIIIAAPLADPGGATNAGAIYVVFGAAAGRPATFNLSSLDGTNGFRLEGVTSFDLSGKSAASAGDVNGDGFDDLVIGAEGASPGGVTDAGSTYVVFGKASGWSATLALSSLNGTNGFRIDGAASGDQSGASVSAVDINKDGFSDLIIGALYADPGGRSSAGSTYVVFGKAGIWTPTFALSGLNGTNGFRLDGEATSDQSGASVASAGDVNGDGFEDIVIGASRALPGEFGTAGSTYVVFGKATGWTSTIALSSLDGSNGFQLDGADFNESGISVDSAGDLNGDGFADLIIGAHRASQNNMTFAGSTYVVFGKASGWTPTLALSSLNGTNGFRIDGTEAQAFSGNEVAGAGDVNGDGFDDLIIGALVADPGGLANAGSSFVVFGKASGWAPTLALSSLNGADGFRLNGGQAEGLSGGSVASAGDVNRDGFDDLIIGAEGFDLTSRPDAGASFVVYGKATAAIIRTAKAGGDLLGGGAFNDSLTGLGGADTLLGGGGNDILTGGAGADSIDGGDGIDTVNYAGAGAAVTVNLDAGTATGGAGTDALARLEAVIGSAHNDVLTGGAGNNLLEGGAGADSIDGGDGIDTVSYAGAGAAVTVNLDAGTASGGAGNDTLARLEAVIGSGHDDVLTGTFGNDLLEGRGGADTLDGLGGTDTISYAAATAGVSVNLTSGSATGGAGVDMLFDIEGVIGSAFADVIGGSYGDDRLVGGDGTDTVSFAFALGPVTVNLAAGTATGGAGNDTLSGFEAVGGSAFDDLIAGSAAGERLDGGDGFDMVSYAGAGSAVSVSLAAGAASGGGGADTLANIEGVIGSTFADSLIGGTDNDVLEGGAGADTLNGGAGTADVARYSGGAVTLFADAPVHNTGHALGDVHIGIERFDFAGVTGQVVYYGAAAGDWMIGGAVGDLIWGNAAGDTLDGHDGDDFLLPGDGADSLIGGAGFDAVFYGDSTVAISLNLATGAHTGFAAGDAFASIEAFLMTEQGDTVVGADVATAGDILYGLGGADSLVGRGGFDWLLGGDGADTLVGGFGFDLMIGGAGADQFVYETGGQGGSGEVISDFQVGVDKIAFVTASTGIAGFTLGQNLLIQAGAPTGSQGTTTGPTLYYDTTSGFLWFDTNGSNVGGLLFLAGLTGAPVLTAADVMVI